ncbi:MAG: hypothetical protein QOJ65_1114 [Fimbriimonadaceae bacterium]|nr:hypothetical protein [Fimbriimonadaceae bacterium]
MTRLRDVTIELNLNPDGTYTESNTLAQATIKGKWTYDEGLVTITPTSIVVGGREISAGGTEIFPLSFTVNSDKTTLTELKPREATTLKGGTDIFTRQ